MNKFLVLAVLSVVSVSCVELEDICRGYFGHFKYNGILVNSFHRVKGQHITLQPLKYYLINDTIKCDPAEFKKKENFLTALKFKNE